MINLEIDNFLQRLKSYKAIEPKEIDELRKIVEDLDVRIAQKTGDPIDYVQEKLSGCVNVEGSAYFDAIQDLIEGVAYLESEK